MVSEKSKNNFQDEIMYLGSSCQLWGVFNPKTEPNWDDLCQQLIDMYSKRGNKACVIHKGAFHALYVQGITFNSNF